MQHSMTRGAARPTAGIIDDIEREDDSKGYEPEDFVRPDVVLWVVPNAAAVPAGWGVAA
ncbi:MULTISPECIES: hypothetical protein [Streptomyces]|uniref:hypothetical protein n=1 Tax=Streptomyces TaxID=1883 RepID=UPI00190B54B1|nr:MULTISPECIES: hypothetical protein [unclassified Streptomyces]WSU71345.1 hypothetical protein OG596_38930 [Streptomyces sp. NBC_01102]MBK3557243.1 hypothetical protein [Streptomyces sp. MBT56]MBK3601835.1 hypothetical protein [Streptomyces sp. MBT54]MBK3616038.1 hypothetical protein [Streptomyces sp. MBT98]MBK3628326.1 hypothetical protein [Streptomyces sp. MBT49]